MATAKAALAVLLLAGLPLAHARAQTPAEFYKGKTVSLYIGFSVGGGYDLYARALARHMGKHIPGNPQIVPRNMEGAGSLRVANFIYQAAPKDGTAFATMGRGSVFGPLFGQGGAQFDPLRYNWLGSMNDEVSICAAWHASGFTKFDDLRAKEAIFGATGPAEEAVMIGKAMNALIGTKLRTVSGYPGGVEINLAIERGEIDGRCALSWSSVKAAHPSWLAQKKIHVLVQVSFAKHAELPDVPLVLDLAPTDEARQILKIMAARQVMGRPFFAPPELPADRAAALRKAFMDTLRDPDFLAEAQRAKLEITPVSAERVEALLKEIYATPAAVIAKTATFVN
jgi:tripartite-type tricarboxylate transporter receptor subunit TctC